MRVNLKMEVVVAKEPMPRVSKKLVTKPVRRAGRLGRLSGRGRRARVQMAR